MPKERIKPSILLPYYFHYTGAENISFKELKKIRKKIEEKFPNVYVDIVCDSIDEYIARNPKWFSEDDYGIILTPDGKSRITAEYLEKINWRISAQVVNEMKRIFEGWK